MPLVAVRAVRGVPRDARGLLRREPPGRLFERGMALDRQGRAGGEHFEEERQAFPEARDGRLTQEALRIPGDELVQARPVHT